MPIIFLKKCLVMCEIFAIQMLKEYFTKRQTKSKPFSFFNELPDGTN